MADVRRLVLELLGRETISPTAKKAGRALDDLGDQAKQTGRSFDKMAAESEAGQHGLDALGDEARQAKRDLERLDRQILVTKATTLALGREFARTGDVELFRGINRNRRTLRNLESLRGTLVHEGEVAAERFGLSFAARVGPLIARAPFGRALTAAFGGPQAGVTAALGIGIVTNLAGDISAAILGGVGTGVAGLGTILAAQDPVVKREAARLGDTIVGELKSSFAAFVPGTRAAIADLESGVAALQPDFEALARSARGFVLPVERGVTGLVRGALPGFARGLERSGGVMLTLQHGAESLGQTLGDTFDDISKGAAGASVAIGDLFAVTEGAIKGVGGTLKLLSTLYLISRTGGRPNRLAEQIVANQTASAGLREELSKLASQLRGGTAAGMTALERTAKDAQAAMQKLSDTTDDLFGQFLGVDEAQLRVRQGMADLRGELAKGKHSLDLASEAGRNHRDALLGQVSKLNDLREAEIKAHVPVDQANRKFADQVKALEATAVAAGYDRTEVDKLLRKYRELPKTVTTNLDAKTKNALSGIQAVRSKLNQLHDKTIAIRAQVYFTDLGLHVPGGTLVRRWGGITEHAQAGLIRLQQARMFSPVSPARYGFAEPATGGEAFIPRRGNRMRSLAIADQAAAWYGGRVTTGQPVNVSVTVEAGRGGSSTDRAFAELFLGLINRGIIHLSVGGDNKTVKVANR